jgi:hypothetical protein
MVNILKRANACDIKEKNQKTLHAACICFLHKTAAPSPFKTVKTGSDNKVFFSTRK